MVTIVCDMCLWPIKEPFARVKTKGEKYVEYFCSEKCFHSGMAEGIFSYMKELGATQESINAAVKAIYGIVDPAELEIEKRIRAENELAKMQNKIMTA